MTPAEVWAQGNRARPHPPALVHVKRPSHHRRYKRDRGSVGCGTFDISLIAFSCAAQEVLTFPLVQPWPEISHFTSPWSSPPQPQHAPQPRHPRTRSWNHDGTTGSCPDSPPRQAKKRGCCIHTRAPATMERSMLSASYHDHSDAPKAGSCNSFLVYQKASLPTRRTSKGSQSYNSGDIMKMYCRRYHPYS